MKQLFKKELSLCLHPAAVIFIFMGAFVCIPNYPYEVMFFFSGLGAFFICLTARENGDLAFSCTLPVKKEYVAYARMLLCVCLQALQLAFALCCILIKTYLFPMPNYAGMDANLALLGLGFCMLGTFNLLFFSAYYKNPNRVGVPFLTASIALFLFVVADIVLSYTVPFYMLLDTVGFEYLGAKLAVLFIGLFVYVGLTAWAFVLAGKRLKAFDL